MNFNTPPLLDLAHLQSWIGKKAVFLDTATPAPLRAMRATLDLDGSDSHVEASVETGAEVGAEAVPALPSLWHWLYFLPTPRQSELGDDGHAARGGFLPPVPLPRRMWAGSQLEFFAPLHVGDALQRTSSVDAVTVKQGRSGPLCFVRVRHEVARQGTEALLLREFHDIVYRPLPSPEDAAPVYTTPPTARVTETIAPSDALLFRYSALTFNTHRIHYDRQYVTQTEGYPGLVVHGPLMATLLAGLAEREGLKMGYTTPLAFEFKALKPVFDLHPFHVCAGQWQVDPMDAEGVPSLPLWIEDHEGHCTLRATMRFKKTGGR